MQLLVALSMMEAGYIALSTAKSSLIPMRNILSEFIEALSLEIDSQSKISTVFEDNEAAKILATTDPCRMTPHSKHIVLRYHWFCEHLSSDTVVIESIDTDKQLADILTKPLLTQKHLLACKMTMGW